MEEINLRTRFARARMMTSFPVAKRRRGFLRSREEGRLVKPSRCEDISAVAEVGASRSSVADNEQFLSPPDEPLQGVALIAARGVPPLNERSEPCRYSFQIRLL